MKFSSLSEIASYIVADGKGILAADESNPTCKKRFDTISVESTETNRRDYRELLFSSKGMSENIGGVILFDETIRQKTELGQSLVDLILESGALPELIGGSADLSGSNNTISKSSVALNENADGNYIYYGVREFGMNAVMNGMSLHGGVIPYAGTFLVFMDYGRNAVRMAALMGIRVIFVFSHDSVALGEDGPTHQPIEHLTTLRSTPNMHTWRPSTLLETAIAWKNALANKQGPSSIILSRQNLENFTVSDLNELDLGGYFISQDTKANINLIATGSEVSLAIQTEEILREEGIVCNVASIPCLETLLENKDQYKKIFNKDKINIVIECAHPNSWYKHTKNVIGIETFGESGAGDDLMNHFGFTPNKIAQKVKKLV